MFRNTWILMIGTSSLLLLLFSQQQRGVLALNFDATLLQQSQRAADLSLAVKSGGAGIPGNTFYRDEPDAALFLEENNICWAAFRGTTLSLDDWLQNINLGTSNVCPTTPGRVCCKAREGFYEAHRDTSYYSSLIQQIRNCKTSCPSCRVILTGHSQGGAIAAIAAVELEDLRPTIITFGQPASIIGRCDVIDVEKYYRFVNTDWETGDLDYDPVPCLDVNADQMGHLILIGKDRENVVVYGDRNFPDISVANWDFTAHLMPRYRSTLNSFDSNKGVGTNGWALGFGCNRNSECKFPGKCIDGDNICYSGLNGDACNGNGDCDSRRCEGVLTDLFSGTCKARLKKGKPCNEKSDCISNKCSWFKCK